MFDDHNNILQIFYKYSKREMYIKSQKHSKNIGIAKLCENILDRESVSLREYQTPQSNINLNRNVNLNIFQNNGKK